ncbi:MAG: ribosome-associated translation inhibitor RaiA [Simkania sp.]|nr:ribosome-associated translation inhibitor RaiA [Simkania sp.]
MVDKSKFAEEDAQGYRLNIIGRHVLVTDAMKKYAWEKVSKVERIHNHLMDMQVTMDIQHLEHTVDIVLKFEHFRIKVHAASTDMYASIDKAIVKLQTLIRRWKDRIQDHHNKKLAVIDMQVNVIDRPYDELAEFNAEIEAARKLNEQKEFELPKVIKKKTLPLKTLTTNEAVMKMELSGFGFLVFRGEEDRKLKVIYRRKDGTYGIMQVE